MAAHTRGGTGKSDKQFAITARRPQRNITRLLSIYFS
jgi:hypothetical protein